MITAYTVSIKLLLFSANKITTSFSSYVDDLRKVRQTMRDTKVDEDLRKAALEGNSRRIELRIHSKGLKNFSTFLCRSS